ncbi:hypothetical protein SASPL_127016 [Salvia splendens]|uniref:Membrane lipoprotein n=1 Tax=Salvia splendens TaxID=180675 RepID=A0A8X8ZRC6_SALSN|nr:uncharacterized protein LOC121747223 [Salvia splendens]KAG6414297.1 hypothetical protein SASPL_127016 [Salvia splendens]
MASSSSRRSCSFLLLLLSFFNFILFILSATSIAPTLALRMPPTSLGWAFLMISSVSLLSSFVGFYSHLTHICFITHASLLLASSAGQLLGMLALFTKEKPSLEMLRSPRDPREAKLLVRLECGILMAMIVMQLGILLLSCVVHSCSVNAEGKIAEEPVATSEMKNRDFDEKMINKYGKWKESDV